MSPHLGPGLKKHSLCETFPSRGRIGVGVGGMVVEMTLRNTMSFKAFAQILCVSYLLVFHWPDPSSVTGGT